MAIDIREILNGPRDYQFYEPDPSDVDSLETVEKAAREGMFNGPGGNEMILRLLEIIRALQKFTGDE